MTEPDAIEGNSKLEPNVNKKRPIIYIALTFFTALCILTISVFFYIRELNQPPVDFPVGESITIEQGSRVADITTLLEKESVVRSRSVLYFFISLFYDTTKIKASTYVFDEPLTALEVAHLLTLGDFDTDLVRFTHFEGERASQIGLRAAETLTKFDAKSFTTIAEPYEGKLFPDTYFLPPDFTEKQLLDLMLETFESQTEQLEELIASHALTLDEIIILASIIEREANTVESKRTVSGILQNRLAIGMALQADASVEYVLDKPLIELTPKDLEIDTPYNTYLYPGLPPTPIGNPGLDAIMAVLEPVESDYFYYITGNDAKFYYAETYDQHLTNIERHLR